MSKGRNDHGDYIQRVDMAREYDHVWIVLNTHTNNWETFPRRNMSGELSPMGLCRFLNSGRKIWNGLPAAHRPNCTDHHERA